MKKLEILVLFMIMILGCIGCQNKEDEVSEPYHESAFFDIPESKKEDSEQSQHISDDTSIMENEEEQQTNISSQTSELLDVPEPFMEILNQYLQIPVGTDLYSDVYWEKLTQGDWKNIYRYLGGKKNICYSLSDLTGDGYPELIMGSYVEVKHVDLDEKVFRIQGTDWENSYAWIYVIYYYNGNEVKRVRECEGNHIELYENGIIHYSGGGVFQPMQYIQFQMDTGDFERREYICLEIDNGEIVGYLKEEGDSMVEITEEEYNQIVDKYTTSPVELQWIVLK